MIEVFISYSHMDRAFKTRLEVGLSQLKRQGQIKSWTDGQIIPGQEWASEISGALERAHIVIFLVSPDFLASDYCIEKELEAAIRRHDIDTAIVIPIVIRPCDWQTTFLGNLQALPDQAIPVSRWDDADDAWLSVIDGMKKVLSDRQERLEIEAQSSLPVAAQEIAKPFKKWLTESEVELAHRNKDVVSLQDIFVYQDLRLLDVESDEIALTVSASEPSVTCGWALIFGDEQTGKTSLAKMIFLRLVNDGQIPLMITGEDVKGTDIEKIAKSGLRQQYDNFDFANYRAMNGKSLIIDDYEKTRLNRKHQITFIDVAKRFFDYIVIIADTSFQYIVPDIPSLDGFAHYELMLFGNVKRYELTKKWVELGVENEIKEDQLYQGIDALKRHADTLVRNNIVPSKPIYLLTILQTFESYSPLGVELTSYGHCYQYLIYRALEKTRISHNEIEVYINFLTELAGYAFVKKVLAVDKGGLEEFAREYNARYISIDKDTVVRNLVLAGILFNSTEGLRFKYKYIYYFYAAKYLSENLYRSDDIKPKIQELIAELHREDSANIIIFITHHSKDAWIIDELQLAMMELFDGHGEATLTSDDLHFMKEFIDEIPKLILEQRDVESERRKDNLLKDEVENTEREIEKQSSELEPTALLAQINKAFKGMEIIGQILRNRHGSLPRNTLVALTEQAYDVGLRFLQFFLSASSTAKDEIVDNIKHHLLENPNIDNERLEKEARNLFLLMTYGVIFGVIRKIGFSVGTKELDEVYVSIEGQKETPAVSLINQTIQLQFMKNLDITTIGNLYSRLKDNPACGRVLKEIVIQYVYMHHVGYKEKQQLTAAIGLPINTQLHLERHSALKG